MRKNMNFTICFTMLALVFPGSFGSAAAALLLEPATAASADEKVDTWADTHPRAASELGEWVNSNRNAARQLFKWDSHHPDQSKTFVTWVTTHQGKGIDLFLAQHTDWNRFNELIQGHRSAMGAFVVWCRFHPKAATALMQHPRALHWVGRHLYGACLKVKDE